MWGLAVLLKGEPVGTDENLMVIRTIHMMWKNPYPSVGYTVGNHSNQDTLTLIRTLLTDTK